MRNKNVEWLVKIAMLSAVATVLMLFEFPLPFIAPPFYEMDFSEVPVLIGAFALGPMAGVAIEAIKILLNFILNGTITAGVGEVANFVMGVVFVLPASMIYMRHRTKKNALLGLIVGGLSMVVLSCFINSFVMLPIYGKAFGVPVESFVQMAAKIHPSIDTMFEFAVLCVAPFNLIKVALVSLITMLLYKHLSPLLKNKKGRNIK